MKPNVPDMRTQDCSELEDWPGYFGAVLGKPPRDTLALLQRGWRVVARRQ